MRAGCLVFTFLLLYQIPGTVLAKEFRLGLITPPKHLWTEAAENFADELHQISGGRHSLTVFPSRQLGNEAQMLQLLQTGALDFAILTISEISNRLPRFGAFYAPYLVEDIDAAAKLLRGPTATKMLELLPENLGVFGVAYSMAGMRQILGRKKIRDVEDVAGIKLRITPFVPIRDFYQLLGAAPTPMPLASVYDALANGQVDAIDMDLETIWKLRYFDYAETLIVSNHMMFPSVGVMSGKTWLQLDEQERSLLTGLMQKHLHKVLDDYPLLESQWQKKIHATGLDVISVKPQFFGSSLHQWGTLWQDKAPDLPALRAEARAIREGRK